MKRQRRRKLIDVDQAGRWELLYRMAANESSRRIVIQLCRKEQENERRKVLAAAVAAQERLQAIS